jgi:tetratricopeptide (TPR) repeat protein
MISGTTLKRLILSALLGSFICGLGSADILYLKNGRKVTGEIFAESDYQVSIKNVLGRMVVLKKNIVRIEREEAQITHQRNGDYLMTRGDYNNAILEYQSALRLDPSNEGIQTKLENARTKAAEALSASMAPDFAAGDDNLKKGFFESAFKEYKSVPAKHDNDPAFLAESNRKIRNLANAMITNANELAYQQDYNKAFEIFTKATTIFSDDLQENAVKAFDQVKDNLFVEADQYLKSGEYAKAVAEFNKMTFAYPGESMRDAVKARLDQISIDLTYESDSTLVLQYLDRSQFNLDAMAMSRVWYNEGNFQQLDILFDYNQKIDGTDESGDMAASLAVNKASLVILSPKGEKQVVPMNDLPVKKVQGTIASNGKAVKPFDFGKIVYNKGIKGDRVDQNAFTGFLGLMARTPMLKSGPAKVGDEWTEAVNEKRVVGSLELTTNGQIKYKLNGFETFMGRDCVKLTMESQLTHMLFGTVVEGEGQQHAVNLQFETPLSGYAYYDHNQKILIRSNMSGDMIMKGSYQQTQTGNQQQQQQASPMMDGAMMGPAAMRPGMDPMMMGPMGPGGQPGMMPGEGMMMMGQQQNVPGSPTSVPQLKVKASAEISLISVSIETPVQAADTTSVQQDTTQNTAAVSEGAKTETKATVSTQPTAPAAAAKPAATPEAKPAVTPAAKPAAAPAAKPKAAAAPAVPAKKAAVKPADNNKK